MDAEVNKIQALAKINGDIISRIQTSPAEFETYVYEVTYLTGHAAVVRETRIKATLAATVQSGLSNLCPGPLPGYFKTFETRLDSLTNIPDYSTSLCNIAQGAQKEAPETPELLTTIRTILESIRCSLGKIEDKIAGKSCKEQLDAAAAQVNEQMDKLVERCCVFSTARQVRHANCDWVATSDRDCGRSIQWSGRPQCISNQCRKGIPLCALAAPWLHNG